MHQPGKDTTTGEHLLEVEGLRTTFRSARGPVTAVNGISFHIDAGEIVGMVGESGCGKSATALSLMRLIPEPPGKVAADLIRFRGENLLAFSGAKLRDLRGKDISMVFQDPMTSLNPMLRIRRQMTEGLRLHLKLGKHEALDQAVEMLRLVGIPAAERRIHDYPHQLSGGMRQRVVIAIALSCNPALILADEPTTALDVTIQAQILELMRSIMRERNTAVMLITHDLGVVAGMCDRVLVMYAGSIVEEASRRDIFYSPRHPYTVGLLRSVPRLDRERAERLPQIEGVPPDLAQLPMGCSFQARCPFVTEVCRRQIPELRTIGTGHRIACHHDITRVDAA
ncbi:MAG TPA: ABC transporter ATP-binding protein [Chloroflexota bacterium]|nr:ABC transporter ATP-binding protein [Chloroflexota bacterium]